MILKEGIGVYMRQGCKMIGCLYFIVGEVEIMMEVAD